MNGICIYLSFIYGDGIPNWWIPLIKQNIPNTCLCQFFWYFGIFVFAYKGTTNKKLRLKVNWNTNNSHDHRC